MRHPEHAMPFCVRHYQICDASERVLAEQADNHQTRATYSLDPPITTDRLASHGAVPGALFEVRCYSE